jgi:hypothetical protein
MKIHTVKLQVIPLYQIIELIGDDFLETISDRWTFGDCTHSLVTAESLISQLLDKEQDIIWNAIKEQLKIEEELLPCDVEQLFVDLES